jgi:hypothetical protein
VVCSTSIRVSNLVLLEALTYHYNSYTQMVKFVNRTLPQLEVKHSLTPFFHKQSFFDPRAIMNAGIPVWRIVQYPGRNIGEKTPFINFITGEYVVLKPKVAHEGFNAGRNCAEAVNFANLEWFNKYKNRGMFSSFLTLKLSNTDTICTCGFHSIEFDQEYVKEKQPVCIHIFIISKILPYFSLR